LLICSCDRVICLRRGICFVCCKIISLILKNVLLAE
jgi:hypothetical protein